MGSYIDDFTWYQKRRALLGNENTRSVRNYCLVIPSPAGVSRALLSCVYV
jgi:hypothetical protein